MPARTYRGADQLAFSFGNYAGRMENGPRLLGDAMCELFLGVLAKQPKHRRPKGVLALTKMHRNVAVLRQGGMPMYGNAKNLKTLPPRPATVRMVPPRPLSATLH